MKIIKYTMTILLSLVFLIAIAAFLFTQQASFGKKPSGELLIRIKTSAQYAKSAFENQENTPALSEDASYWKIMLQMFSKAPERNPTDTLPFHKPDYTFSDTSETKITWFGHSSIFIQSSEKNILMDPVFSERASPVHYFGSKNYMGTDTFSIDQFPNIDIVLISHDHYDHLDYGSIQKLKTHSSNALYYVPLGVSSHLIHWGISPANIVELDWWEEEILSDSLRLVATPARHFSGRGLLDRNKTLWTSFVLLGSKEKIYLGGDSGYGKHFKEIGDKYGPFDIAFLECGQYNAWWPFIHMMPEQVVQAGIDLKTNTLIPIHWGKFTLGLHSWKEPVERLDSKAKELQINVQYPYIGRTFSPSKINEKKIWWKEIN